MTVVTVMLDERQLETIRKWRCNEEELVRLRRERELLVQALKDVVDLAVYSPRVRLRAQRGLEEVGTCRVVITVITTDTTDYADDAEGHSQDEQDKGRIKPLSTAADKTFLGVETTDGVEGHSQDEKDGQEPQIRQITQIAQMGEGGG